MGFRIQEPLARQALDSAREVSGFYARWSAVLERAGKSLPTAHARFFDRVCRVRDHLATALRDAPIRIDLDKADADDVVTCAVFSMETVADLMEQPGVNVEEWDRFTTTMRLLYSVAIEFASDAVKVIGRFDRTTPFPHAVRRMIDAVNAKVNSGDVKPMPSMRRPERLRKLDPEPIYQGDGPFSRNPLPAQAARRPICDPGLAVGACIDFRSDADVEFEATAATTESEALAAFPINVRSVREPRLRTLMELSQRRLAAALDANDYRIAAVLLVSLIEAVVLEVALRRRHELRLRGKPDAWDLREILSSLLEEHDLPVDPQWVEYVMSCRDLLDPAVQLLRPVVIERETMGRMLRFARRFTARAGFSAAKVVG